jgi:BASS family bile acid:Na+ symporter
MVAAGFVVLAVCPGAPYGPPFTAIAKGSVAVAVGLIVSLLGTLALAMGIARIAPGSSNAMEAPG